MTPLVTHSYQNHALKINCSYIVLGFVHTHCFAPSIYANYHGKLEFCHFSLPSSQEQLMTSVSVPEVGLSDNLMFCVIVYLEKGKAYRLKGLI